MPVIVIFTAAIAFLIAFVVTILFVMIACKGERNQRAGVSNAMVEGEN